jgi:cytochrome c oxidase subunit III
MIGPAMQSSTNGQYYLPQPSFWPISISASIVIFFIGAANWLHYQWFGPYLLFLGLFSILIVMFGWFSTVIHENRTLRYNQQVDHSFRWGMAWFIFSEVLFFGGFFAALFYTRVFSVPELGGETYPLTHLLLWPDFTAAWPLLHNPDNNLFLGASSVGNTWGIPALNTLLLLSSGVTLTIAHWGLGLQKRAVLIWGLLFTILLGVTFLGCQGSEYYAAYHRHGLTLNAGSYGSLFFILTGFHGAHVTIGTTMLIVMLIRSMQGDFSPKSHFAFNATAWYWHFVDVVWLMLFVFVYWI